MADERMLTIEDLADAVGVPVRTIRYYIAEGLLPGPGARGKGAAYGEDHLLRLRLIRRLGEQRVPLAEIRDRVGRLALREVRALLAEAERGAAALQRAAEAPSPKAYVSELLARARAARPAPQAEAPASPRQTRLRETATAGPLREPSPWAETWRRWELAPGVELHVRGDAHDRHRGLIVRLLRAASEPER